jgi:hypothetical protein
MARRHQQVLAHGEVRKNAAPLGDVGDAEACDAKGRQGGQRFSGKGDRSRARAHESQHGADRRRFAHSVAAHERDRLTFRDRKIHAVQDVAAAAKRVQAACIEHVQTGMRIESAPR